MSKRALVRVPRSLGAARALTISGVSGDWETSSPGRPGLPVYRPPSLV
jgi:hypothetical protein